MNQCFVATSALSLQRREDKAEVVVYRFKMAQEKPAPFRL